MYANLANRSHSNHGYLTFISEGDVLGLSERAFKTESFNQKSWEATIWFCEMTPSYLRHNLYKETVVQTSLLLPKFLLETIKDFSVKIERFYERLDLSILPPALL